MSQVAAELEKKDELWWMPKGRQLMKGNHAVCAGRDPRGLHRVLRLPDHSAKRSH